MNKVYNVFCLVSAIGASMLGYSCMINMQNAMTSVANAINSSPSQLLYIAKK